jgi:putative FmdB family regulatory protein
MPIFEYSCKECNVLIEKIYPSLEKSAEVLNCPRCGETRANRLSIPTSVSLSRSSMDNSPIDNVIGKDADARWQDIHNRQASRDVVRKETGSVGLSELSRGEFAPVTKENLETRVEVSKSLEDGQKIKPGKEASRSWLSSVD